MTADDVYNAFVAGFKRRKFSAGLLISFIDFYVALGVPGLGLSSFDEFLAKFPRKETVLGGGKANTLIVLRNDGLTLSLRSFYDNAERFFRAEHKRFDYPSCAPHATQAWGDYIDWLDAIVRLSSSDISILREKVVDFVLSNLKSQEFDPLTIKVDPPLFKMVLETFDLSIIKGEPTGAAFQGVVFGFLRADNPHLQIEIDKVRVGSKRLQRVGDIDCWEGARLAISAEVKQKIVEATDVDALKSFGNETGKRGTLGLVVALDFEDGVRQSIEEVGLKPLNKADLLRIVELWDPLKQRTAVASMVYHARHVEKNSVLADRLDLFLKTAAGEIS